MTFDLSSTPASMLTTGFVAAFPSAFTGNTFVPENNNATVARFIATGSDALELVVLSSVSLVRIDLVAGAAHFHPLIPLLFREILT